MNVERLHAAVEDAAQFYRHQLPSSWVPRYLAHRRLSPALDEPSPWHVGYAPKKWTALTDHLRNAGYRDTTLEAAGLAARARTGHLVDRFRDRLVIPIRNTDGRVVAFIGRAHPQAGDTTPKYLNSPTTAVYRKGEHLLGTGAGAGPQPEAAAARTPVLVEGPMDALAVWVASPSQHAPLTLCGTALTTQQAQIVQDAAGASGTPVVVATDADAAGHAAAAAAYRHLTAQGLRTVAADLPPGVDPAQLLQEHGPVRLTDALTAGARPLIEDLIDRRVAASADRLRWVEGRVAVVRDLAPLIAALPPAQRERPLTRLVDLVGVETDTAQREVRTAAAAAAAGQPTARSDQRRSLSPSRAPTIPTSARRRPAVHRSTAR